MNGQYHRLDFQAEKGSRRNRGDVNEIWRETDIRKERKAKRNMIKHRLLTAG